MQETLMVPAPEEALNPREVRLENASRIFRWGAIVNALFALLILIVGLAGGMGAFQNVFGVMQSALLFRYVGTSDTALAIVMLLTLANVSFLLVAMVGTVARELWVFVLIALLVAANGAALALWGYSPALLTLIFALIGGAVIVRDPRAFRMNPVMVKELRGRMRGIRAFMVITIYLGLMSAFTVLLYLIQAQQQAITSSAAGGIIGRVLFAGVVGVELLLIIFIAPSFTAGAITGERERKTYDLLQTTLLASPSFVIGKLESALGYVLLLLLSAIPLQSIAFLFGGVSETEVILSFVILAVTAIGLGTVGLFFSTSVERTLSASVRAYTVALVITFGVPVVLLILLSVIETIMRGASASGVLPAWVEILTVYFRDFLISLNPITTAIYTQQLLISNQQIGFGLTTLSSTGATIPNVSPWITFTIMYLVMSALLIVLSVRRMRRIEA